MTTLLNNPVFGVTLSLLAFEIGCYLYKKTKIAFFNPLLIAQGIILFILIKFNISFDEYNKGGQFITFFLGPATVVLAVPLYKKLSLLKAHISPILIGITVGSTVSMLSIIGLCRVFSLNTEMQNSLLPKSITVPIGMEISKSLNGIPSITVIAIIITGIIGAVIGPFVCKTLKIKHKIAVGIAIGTSSHALGTTKAMELGETEGAMSALSIGVAGIITVFLAPLLLKVLSYFIP